MKRKKKITVSYLEKDSKREGLQGLCRIVHDGVSTMFKIGVVKEDDTKGWFRDNSIKIRELLELERDIMGDEFTVKGFHYRWERYDSPITLYLDFKYIIVFLSLDLQDILTVKESNYLDGMVYDRKIYDEVPLTVNMLYHLLTPGIGIEDSKKESIRKIIIDNDYLSLLNLELFHVSAQDLYEGDFRCHDFLLNKHNMIELYAYFLSKPPSHHIGHVKDVETSNKLKEIYSILDVEEMDSEYNLAWIKSELNDSISLIFKQFSHNPMAPSVFKKSI